MGRGLHEVFKTAVKEISQYLPPLGESGLEVSHFIPEYRNFFWSGKIVRLKKEKSAEGYSEVD